MNQILEREPQNCNICKEDITHEFFICGDCQEDFCIGCVKYSDNKDMWICEKCTEEKQSGIFSYVSVFIKRLFKGIFHNKQELCMKKDYAGKDEFIDGLITLVKRHGNYIWRKDIADDVIVEPKEFFLEVEEENCEWYIKQLEEIKEIHTLIRKKELI